MRRKEIGEREREAQADGYVRDLVRVWFCYVFIYKCEWGNPVGLSIKTHVIKLPNGSLLI